MKKQIDGPKEKDEAWAIACKIDERIRSGVSFDEAIADLNLTKGEEAALRSAYETHKTKH